MGPLLFQFKFESEKDLQTILSKAPFHFKRWMLILQRWESVVSDYFPALFPFWITIHGLPLHYWTKKALDAIGNELGPVEAYEVEKGRIRVLINGLKPLEMKLDVSVAGAIKQVELDYDDLGKHCFICFSLSHEKENCPSQRALANSRNSDPYHMGISQSRTLKRLDADRRKGFERKQTCSEASQWQRPPNREIDWREDRSFRYNYGARWDPNYISNSNQSVNPEEDRRRPARERLSFCKEDISSSCNVSHNRAVTQNPRTEWRPITGGSQQRELSKSVQSLVSHTPSPRPQREG